MSGLIPTDARSAAFALGIGTVVVTHTAMVLNLLPGEWMDVQMKSHAYINLAAAAAILYGHGYL